MGRITIRELARRAGVGILLIFCVFWAHATPAEILRARLQVNGLACPFCAFGIEKKLRALDGVREVEVLLDEGIVKLRMAPPGHTRPDAIEQAVARAGFELAALRLVVRGRLAEGDSGLVLDVGDGVRFALVERRAGRLEPLGEETTRELRALANDGQLTVEGAVEGGQSGLRQLVVESSEAAP